MLSRHVLAQRMVSIVTNHNFSGEKMEEAYLPRPERNGTSRLSLSNHLSDDV